jgi:hypothetical protein
LRVISEELQAFIRTHLRSVWELELLLLVSRDPVRSWSAEELNRELRSSLGLISQILSKLEHAGLVTATDDQKYRYQPRSAEIEQVVRQLEEAYAARPLTIVRAILAGPNEKIQTLADAFKVKKD